MKKLLTTITFFLCLLLCAGTQSIAKTTAKKKNQTVKITISAAGDCTLGVDSRYNNTFNYYYNQNGAAYFLKKVKPIFSKDDVTIVNFEGTLTNSATRANKTFTFKGPSFYTSILKKGSVESYIFIPYLLYISVANSKSIDICSSSPSIDNICLNG